MRGSYQPRHWPAASGLSACLGHGTSQHKLRRSTRPSGRPLAVPERSPFRPSPRSPRGATRQVRCHCSVTRTPTPPTSWCGGALARRGSGNQALAPGSVASERQLAAQTACAPNTDPNFPPPPPLPSPLPPPRLLTGDHSLQQALSDNLTPVLHSAALTCAERPAANFCHRHMASQVPTSQLTYSTHGPVKHQEHYHKSYSSYAEASGERSAAHTRSSQATTPWSRRCRTWSRATGRRARA